MVVVEPTPASMLTGRRLAAMPQKPRAVVVANKIREPGDIDRVRAGTGLPVIGAVPFDRELAVADRLALAVLDHDPEGLTATAVRLHVDVLRNGLEPSWRSRSGWRADAGEPDQPAQRGATRTTVDITGKLGRPQTHAPPPNQHPDTKQSLPTQFAGGSRLRGDARSLEWCRTGARSAVQRGPYPRVREVGPRLSGVSRLFW